MDLEKKNNEGYIWMPYIPKVVSVMINSETVWYSNKWKNLLLKIKRIFIKPEYLKNIPRYTSKPVNPDFYETFRLTK